MKAIVIVCYWNYYAPTLASNLTLQFVFSVYTMKFAAYPVCINDVIKY